VILRNAFHAIALAVSVGLLVISEPCVSPVTAMVVAG
jgi:hypothetical protein